MTNIYVAETTSHILNLVNESDEILLQYQFIFYEQKNKLLKIKLNNFNLTSTVT